MYSLKATSKAVSLLAFFLTFAPVQAEDEEKVSLDKVPKVVLKAVTARFPGAKLLGAEKENEDGKTVYEIALTHKKRQLEVSLTEDGTIVEIERVISAKDMPKVVSEAVANKYPKATYKKVEEVIKVKEGEEQPARYEVLLVTADDKKYEVLVDQDGKILKEEAKQK